MLTLIKKVATLKSLITSSSILLLLMVIAPYSTPLFTPPVMWGIKLLVSMAIGPLLAHGIFPLVYQFILKKVRSVKPLEEGNKETADKASPRPVQEKATARSALFRGIRDGDIDMVKRAVQKGANVNEVLEGKTPLHYACTTGSKRMLRITTYLLAHGADPLAIDIEGLTALQQAAKNGLYEIFEFFKDIELDTLYAGSIFDHAPAPFFNSHGSTIGATPLMQVVNANIPFARKKAAIIKLLELGANPNISSQINSSPREAFEITPLGQCIRQMLTNLSNNTYAYNRDAQYGLEKIRESFELIKIMLNHGANPLAVYRQYIDENYYAHKTPAYKQSAEENLLALLDKVDRIKNSQQFKDLNTLLEQAVLAQNKAFKADDFAKAITDKEIAHAIQEAAIHYSLGGKKAYIELIDMFMACNPINGDGLESLINHIKPTDKGYVHLHSAMAHQYFHQAGAEFDEAYQNLHDKKIVGKRAIHLLNEMPAQQDEVNLYRQFCLKHCLLGLQTQEPKSKAKNADMDLLNLLLNQIIKEWSLEELKVQEDKLAREDVMHWVAGQLIKFTQLKKAQVAQPELPQPEFVSKTYLPSQTQIASNDPKPQETLQDKNKIKPSV